MNTNQFDLGSFRIILPPARNISMSELRIASSRFIFSPVAVADLGYPQHICMLYSEENQQILVTASEPAEYTLPFLPDGIETPVKALSVSHMALVRALRSRMHWSGSETYRVVGIRIPDTSYLAFDLKTAACGKRKRQKLNPDEFLATCPSVREIAMRKSLVPLAQLPSVSGL